MRLCKPLLGYVKNGGLKNSVFKCLLIVKANIGLTACSVPLVIRLISGIKKASDFFCR